MIIKQNVRKSGFKELNFSSVTPGLLLIDSVRAVTAQQILGSLSIARGHDTMTLLIRQSFLELIL